MKIYKRNFSEKKIYICALCFLAIKSKYLRIVSTPEEIISLSFFHTTIIIKLFFKL